jgi:hypothetical protein
MNARLVSLLLAGALCASAVVNVLQARAACSGCALCGQPSAARIQDCIECLALSPEQCSTLLAECSSCCGSGCTAEGRIAAVQTDLQRALRSVPMDAARVRELGDELVRLRGEAITTGIEAALRMRAVLTPEQLRILERSLGMAKTE